MRTECRGVEGTKTSNEYNAPAFAPYLDLTYGEFAALVLQRQRALFAEAALLGAFNDLLDDYPKWERHPAAPLRDVLGVEVAS